MKSQHSSRKRLLLLGEPTRGSPGTVKLVSQSSTSTLHCEDSAADRLRPALSCHKIPTSSSSWYARCPWCLDQQAVKLALTRAMSVQLQSWPPASLGTKQNRVTVMPPNWLACTQPSMQQRHATPSAWPCCQARNGNHPHPCDALSIASHTTPRLSA
jgi:hypothetical protein